MTPSHQFPLGAILPQSRRRELVRWAAQTGAYILEDDYDSELRAGASTVAALQTLDASGRVIYVGTFSKVLFPALRLGYVVVLTPSSRPRPRSRSGRLHSRFADLARTLPIACSSIAEGVLA